MSKAIVGIGYKRYVLEIEDAVTLGRLLATAELYEEKWRRVEDGGTTKHVWGQEEGDGFTVIILPEAAYQIYKLAGKPKE